MEIYICNKHIKFALRLEFIICEQFLVAGHTVESVVLMPPLSSDHHPAQTHITTIRLQRGNVIMMMIRDVKQCQVTISSAVVPSANNILIKNITSVECSR